MSGHLTSSLLTTVAATPLEDESLLCTWTDGTSPSEQVTQQAGP